MFNEFKFGNSLQTHQSTKFKNLAKISRYTIM